MMGETPQTILAEPPHLPLVLPSILSADFARLGDEVADVLDAGADGVHVDVMDGHFVPNLTMGPAVIRSLRRRFADLFLDVHLMLSDPVNFLDPFAEAGADCLTFHAEVVEPDAGLALIGKIHQLGCAAGITINPPTDAAAIQPFLDAVDLVLVMSVHPGYSGQSFMPEVLNKTRSIASKLRDDQRLEMDGGINGQTVAAVRGAGCDTLVAASYVFGADDRAAAIASLRGGP
jgi:ribulose-phosphate 3-epimerase